MKIRALLTLPLAIALFATPALRAADVVSVDLGRGPVDVFIPDSYEPDTPAPLLLLLHGYSSTGLFQEFYMQFGPVADAEGMIYAYPDGTQDFFGLQFWNATDACCDFFFSGTDDSGYLLDLIETIEANLNVDSNRIYVTGHSNGGFMSYRMACDHSEKIAAIASLAGATWLDDSDCGATEPVNILQIHGTQDETISYDGGCLVFGCYPSAIDTAKTWASTNGCEPVVDGTAGALDLDDAIGGAETDIARVEQGCFDGGSVELWRMNDSAHSPGLNGNYAQAVIDYLLAHPKE